MNEPAATTTDDDFVRVARFVGDFGNSFSAEQGQRAVWREASGLAVALPLGVGLIIRQRRRARS